MGFRLATTCGVFMLMLAPFGVFATWWGPFLAFGSQVLTGMAFATLVYGFTTRLNSPEGFGVLFRLGVFPLFLFSGAFFPVANLGPVGEWVAKLTPLWQGVNLSRMFCVDNVDWPLAAVNVAVLVAITVAGWFWSVSGLDEAAGALMAVDLDHLGARRSGRCRPSRRLGCWCCATTWSTARPGSSS